MADQELFLNHYKCGSCGYEWDDVYDCAVDDDCTNCGARHYTPVWSAGEDASYRRFAFVEPGEDSEEAYGPFETAAERDTKAAQLARSSDHRIVMLDLIDDHGTIVPVVFPYRESLLEPSV